MNSPLTKLLKRLVGKETSSETEQVQENLQCAIRMCREKLAARNRFYASLPLGREQEWKLPKNQWTYFLRGKVGIKYVGENLTSSVTYIKSSEEVELPNLLDSERQHKLRVIRGYIIDRISGRRYTACDTINFQRGEPMHLTLNGYVWMAWIPPLPAATLPFYRKYNAASNSEYQCEYAASSADTYRYNG